MRKVYVSVICKHEADGKITPLKFYWEDGRPYEIDRVLDIRPAASLKAGGCGLRYMCRIQGRQVPIFLEDEGRFFMEGR